MKNQTLEGPILPDLYHRKPQIQHENRLEEQWRAYKVPIKASRIIIHWKNASTFT